MRPSKKNIAVVAGLGVVLALSPVVGPVSTALAEETGETTEYGLWAGDDTEHTSDEGTTYHHHHGSKKYSLTLEFHDMAGVTVDDVTLYAKRNETISFGDFVRTFVRHGHEEYADAVWSLVPGGAALNLSDTFDYNSAVQSCGRYEIYMLGNSGEAESHQITLSFHDMAGVTLDYVTLETESDGIVFSEFVNALVADGHEEYADAVWSLVPGGAAMDLDDVISVDNDYVKVYMLGNSGEAESHQITLEFHDMAGVTLDYVTLETESDGIVFSEFVNALVADGHEEYADAVWSLVPGGAAMDLDDVISVDNSHVEVYMLGNSGEAESNEFAVTFNDADGNVIDTVTLETESDGIVFSEFLDDFVAAHPEYADVTWSLLPTGAPISPTSAIGYSVNVYALEEAEDPATLYTVNFHDEDGELVRGVTRGGAWTLQSYIDDAYLSGLERDGYTLHWVTSLSDPDGSEVLPTDTVLANLDLYAYYTEDEAEDPETETYDVTFWDGLESTEDQVITVNAGGTVDPADVAEPTCEGYTFLGWYADTDLTVEFDFTAPIYADTTVYAKWEKDADAELPSDEEQPTTPSDPGEAAGTEDQKGDRKDVPETGDATVAVAGIGALGSALAGVGAFLKRRRS